jgi:hypothetical protein
VVASVSISDDAAGLGQVLALLAEHDPAGGRLPVAIETSQGLLVAGLRAAGRQVFAINPLAVSRYRDGTGPRAASRTPSTRWCWRTFCAPMRTRTGPLPADSELLQSLRVLNTGAAGCRVGPGHSHQLHPNTAASVLPSSVGRFRTRRAPPAGLAGSASDTRRRPDARGGGNADRR